MRRSRRLAVESLESRQMFCATLVDFDSVPQGLAVADPHTEMHHVHGGGIEFPDELAVADSGGAGGTFPAASGLLHPLTDIPLLHSKPSATAKLYLDFDGNFEPVWVGVGAFSI
jgi:hypothetical protein